MRERNSEIPDFIINYLIDASRIIIDADSTTDIAHRFSHHLTVIQNCQKIIELEGLENRVDFQALIVAAAWHDYKRHNHDYNHLSNVIASVQFSDDFRDKVIKIIENHSFADNPQTLEELVLYDADKIEYLSKRRFEEFLAGIKSGEVTQEQLEYYKKLWQERMPKVCSKLHFDSAKKLFKERLPEINKWITSHSEFFQWKVNKE